MVYLILVIIVINIFIFQYINFSKTQNEIEYKTDMRLAAENILNQLVSSDECLAYKENVTVLDVKTSDITHKVLDVKKIEKFENEFSFYEPNCTKKYNFGYYVLIEKYNLTRKDVERNDLPPYKGKDVVLIVDATASMKEGNKISYAKSAAKSFLKCANIDNRVGVVVLKDCNNIDVFNYYGKNLLELTDENKKEIEKYIDSINVLGNTAIKDSLREANKILKDSDNPERYKMILLMTDGCESCPPCNPKDEKDPYASTMCKFYKDYCLSCPKGENICDYAKNIDENFHVFTVGLFTDITCPKEEEKGGQELKCIADIRKGKYYLATSPKKLENIFCNLGKGIEESKDEKESWIIGQKSHSIGKSLRGSFSFYLPVTIKYNQTYMQTGKITLYLFDGELETLTSILDEACENGEYTYYISVSYKTFLEKYDKINKICMIDGTKIFCKATSCNKNIDFPELKPGSYYMKISSNNNVKVFV
ncbi:MAG: vWA domain-containing protein [Candidatus Aenigmatarchaeota archaeon]